MPDPLGYSIFLKPTDAIRAFDLKDEVRSTVRWSEMMHGEHATAFTVAKVAKLDLLRTMKTSLDEQMRDGGSFERWKSGILPDLQKAGWWGTVQNRELTGTDEQIFVGERRLRNIYNTNVRMSLAAGHWTRIQRQKAVFPYLRYVPSTAEHRRREHMAWYGIILPVDHPFWQTHFPPNGWGCKCGFEQVTEARLAKKGWTITPDDKLPAGPVRLFHAANGDEIEVPRGIDAGFSYNPGTAHLRAIADKAADSIEQAVGAGLRDQAEATLRQLVDDPAFAQFVALPDLPFPVMILDDQLRDAIGAQASVAVLSQPTMEKQDAKRSEMPIAAYRHLAGLPAEADIIAREGDNVLKFARKLDGRWIVAVLKRTASGKALFVQSVREQNERSLPRFLSGAEVIIDRRS